MAKKQKESWRTRRLEKRAAAERAVVDGCVYHINKKLEDSSRNVGVIKQKLSIADAELIERCDKGESLDAATARLENLQIIESQLEMEENLSLTFARLKSLLSSLLIQIDMLIRLEDYKFVIKTIPEKKIPEYIKASSADDISAIVNLTTQLLEKFEQRVTLVSKAKAKLREQSARIVGVAENMRSETESTDEDKRAALEAFRKRAEARHSDLAVPVPARMTETNEAPKPTNKA